MNSLIEIIIMRRNENNQKNKYLKLKIIFEMKMKKNEEKNA